MSTFWTRAEYHSIIWKDLFGKEDCPLCDQMSNDGHTLWKGKYWYILHNIFPYSGDDRHIMAAPYAHKKYSHELSESEILELSDIFAFVKHFYQDGHYFSCTRETLGNRSIEHFHMHFLPWILEGKFLRKMLELQWFPIVQDLKLD